MNDQRLLSLQNWLQTVLSLSQPKLTLLAGDASFRRYFRLYVNNETFVVMDAPPEKEDCHPFVAVAKALKQQGVAVPDVLHVNFEEGFLVLSDLGDALYSTLLNEDSVDSLYASALEVILRIQRCRERLEWSVPHFGREVVMRELHLFPDWFLAQHLKFESSAQHQKMLNTVFEKLLQFSEKQPKVFVHRDYHSRNLLLTPDQRVGVLDFQDAVWGPIAYDAVSLLRDCYVAWPKEKVVSWAMQFYEQARDAHGLKHFSADEFMQGFDWIGIQRHLKVVGIFSRLCHRDGKSQYLADFPRIFNYLLTGCEQYSEFNELRDFLLMTQEMASEKI